MRGMQHSAESVVQADLNDGLWSPLPGRISPAIAIRGWCCGGARGRDRALRLPVIRLRPRAFCASSSIWWMAFYSPRATPPCPGFSSPGPVSASAPWGRASIEVRFPALLQYPFFPVFLRVLLAGCRA